MTTPQKRTFEKVYPTPHSNGKKQRVEMPAYFKNKSRSQKPYVRKSKSNGSKVKDEILKMAARYHSTIPDSVGGDFNMLHNQLYSLNLTSFISQGVEGADRTGDQVYLETLKMRGYLNSPNASGAFSYRVIVGWASDQVAVANLSAVGIPYSSLFLPDTGSTAAINGIINPKSFTALFDQQYDINSSLPLVADIRTLSASIGLNQKFEYKANRSLYGKSKNLIMVVIPYVIGGGGSSIAGACQIATDICFKNL